MNFLDLGWGEVVDRLVDALGVEPVDVVEGLPAAFTLLCHLWASEGCARVHKSDQR